VILDLNGVYPLSSLCCMLLEPAILFGISGPFNVVRSPLSWLLT
jgi:hypothetical protein